MLMLARSLSLSLRLKKKVENRLLDNFVAALELLCSPELVIKVPFLTSQTFSLTPLSLSPPSPAQDIFENDLKPAMEATQEKRNTERVSHIWRQMLAQLCQWEEGSSSSLYGEETPSLEIGNLQKRFAKVSVFVVNSVFCCM